jgi:hypothetical protein
MAQQRRTALAGGIILIVLGVMFLVGQIVPEFSRWLRIEYSWPLWVIGWGAFLFILGLLTGAPGLAVPACIVAGIGGLLYWQNATGNWGSWAYAWALIPGFVGIGTLLMGILGEKPRESITGGLWMMFISLILFFIFGSVFGGLGLFGPYWPVLLIGLGVVVLLRSFFGRR